jgi:hypothetical protein
MFQAREAAAAVAGFISRWGALVSGGLTIPFTIAGLYSDPKYAKPIWFSSAAFALLVAFYLDHTSKMVRIRELEDRLKPRLKLSYAAEKTVMRGPGHRYTFLSVTNESARNIDGVLTKIIESKFKKDGSELWVNTCIIANLNMSWCALPDHRWAAKYSAMQLQPGSELVDFISGPHTEANSADTANPSGHFPTNPFFKIRIDPAHVGVGVLPFFGEKGTYKFVMQVSAPDAGKPEQLTFIH